MGRFVGTFINAPPIQPRVRVAHIHYVGEKTKSIGHEISSNWFNGVWVGFVTQSFNILEVSSK